MKKLSWYSRDRMKAKCVSLQQSVLCGVFDYRTYLLSDVAELLNAHSSHKLLCAQNADYCHTMKNVGTVAICIDSLQHGGTLQSAHSGVYGYCMFCEDLPYHREDTYSSQNIHNAQIAMKTCT